MRILVVAADAMEFRGMPRRSDFLLKAGGVGAKCAAAAVDAALKEFPADAVISTGFCGALDPAMNVGDVVVATEVVAGNRRFPALQPASTRVSCLQGEMRHAQACATHRGVVISIDHVAQTAAEKARLHASGAIAVEMEAGAVAEHAAARGLPFYCIKVVTDLASEHMANDFNSALRSDGHFDTMVILRSSLRQPLVRIPELIRLRKRCARAALLLGEFIADCRF
jgi:adenosylhomocysteine nucleosidase